MCVDVYMCVCDKNKMMCHKENGVTTWITVFAHIIIIIIIIIIH
jgi:hypothetical protein